MTNYTFQKTTGLEERLSGKRVYMVPMYSMRDYETGQYNLMCDGNVNRVLSKLSQCKDVTLEILVPENVVGHTRNWFERELMRLKREGCLTEFYLINCDYGENANATRKDPKWFNVVDSVVKQRDIDIFIFEPNIVGSYLQLFEGAYDFDAIYWCPVSAYDDRNASPSMGDRVANPSFISEFKNIDVSLARSFEIWVASQSQWEYFTDIVGVMNVKLDNNLFDVEQFLPTFSDVASDAIDYPEFKNTVFFPFRLTDDGYEFKKIVYVLNEAMRKGELKGLKVLYTNPNNSDLPKEMKLDPSIYFEVPSDRWNYYKILKRRPIIIYMDDPTKILHMSIFEFAHFNCPIIHRENNFFSVSRSIDSFTQNSDTVPYRPIPPKDLSQDALWRWMDGNYQDPLDKLPKILINFFSFQ